MTEILHGAGCRPCNFMQLMHKYSFRAGKSPSVLSTGFCGYVDNTLWTNFPLFSTGVETPGFRPHPLWRPQSFPLRGFPVFSTFFYTTSTISIFYPLLSSKTSGARKEGNPTHEVFL